MLEHKIKWLFNIYDKDMFKNTDGIVIGKLREYKTQYFLANWNKTHRKNHLTVFTILKMDLYIRCIIKNIDKVKEIGYKVDKIDYENADAYVIGVKK